MKKVFTLLFLLITTGVLAQPTITSPSLSLFIGSNYVLIPADTATLPGPAGADVSWDFSGLPLDTGANYTITIASPTLDTFGLKYPNANIELDGPGYEAFQSLTDTAVEVWGSYNSSEWTIYAVGDEEIKFPLTYASTWTSNYAGNQYLPSVPYAFPLNGSRTVIADGWGTIKTAVATYSNVIRLVSYDRAVYHFDTSTEVVTDTVYSWIVQGQVTPVLTISHAASHGITGTVLSYSATVLVSTTAGINEVNKTPLITIFPNPSHDWISIGNGINISGNCNVSIYNVVGQLSKQTIISHENNMQIDIAGLAPGYYTGVISDDKNMFYHFKFVKQ